MGTIWREAEYIRKRENNALANSTVALQLVAAATMGGKDASQPLKDFIRELTND